MDQFHKSNNDDIELMMIRLDFEKLRPILICALYRPPTGSISNFNTTVDLIFNNNPIDLTSGILDLNISDHLPT